MTTTTERAASRMSRTAARCASTARPIAWQVISGLLAFLAAAAVIAYGGAGTGITGRLLAVAAGIAAYGALLSLPGWVHDLRATEDESA